MATRFDSVSQIYKYSHNASVSWRSITFPYLQVFTHSLQKLIVAVGELDEDDYWFRFISKLRRFRFSIVAAPMTDTVLHAQMQSIYSDLASNIQQFQISFPGAVEQYKRLLTSSERLTNINLAQLLSSLTAEINQTKNYKQTVVLVSETRFVTECEKGLLELGIQGVEVTSPSFLREDISFRNMIVIGPTRWYPDFVFTAPRSENILILKYSWIRDHWKHQNSFVAPLKTRANKLMQTTLDESFEDTELDADALLPPSFDFQNIKRQVAAENKGHNDVDYVQARPFLLEEDWVVLLESEDTSSSLVIDLSDMESPVKKIKVNEIEPGVYVLLRTTGGGDFIVPIADQIMGKDGIRAREYQRYWKKMLRQYVIEFGYKDTVEWLQKFGATRASIINVRNWMSERSIKTEFRNDFDGIMQLLKLESESDLYWNLMEQIDHAHRKAGHKIRQMLLDKVKNSDLRALKRTGKMDFELESEANISITAFQVRHISPDTIKVLPWQLGLPLKQGV